MPRRFSVDGDDSRLPDGMIRIGYDADTQTYTFRDTDGSLWEGPSGCEYGRMTRVSGPPKQQLPSVDIELGATTMTTTLATNTADDDLPPSYDESEEASVPFLDHATYTSRGDGGRWDSARHWRAELMPLLNFFMILALFLIGLFWFLGWMTSSSRSLSSCAPGAHAHQIQKGESCWSIAQMHDIGVDQLQEANEGIDCALLHPGRLICVPAMPKA